jgi:hypothetical protein
MVNFPRDPVDVKILRKQVTVVKPEKTVVSSTSAPTVLRSLLLDLRRV